MRTYRILIIILFMFFNSVPRSWSQEPTPSSPLKLGEETEACIECHKSVTPGIVEDWMTSRHAKTSPERGLAKPILERRISNEEVPASLRSVAVGCFECHSQNPSSHKDNFDHFGYKINVVVSPNDCRTCHKTEAEQYAEGKKAHALGNLRDNAVYQALLQIVDGVQFVEGSKMHHADATAATKHETCYACHGTEVEVHGTKTVTTSVGDIEVPISSTGPIRALDGRIRTEAWVPARHATLAIVSRSKLRESRSRVRSVILSPMCLPGMFTRRANMEILSCHGKKNRHGMRSRGE